MPKSAMLAGSGMLPTIGSLSQSAVPQNTSLTACPMPASDVVMTRDGAGLGCRRAGKQYPAVDHHVGQIGVCVGACLAGTGSHAPR